MAINSALTLLAECPWTPLGTSVPLNSHLAPYEKFLDPPLWTPLETATGSREGEEEPRFLARTATVWNYWKRRSKSNAIKISKFIRK